MTCYCAFLVRLMASSFPKPYTARSKSETRINIASILTTDHGCLQKTYPKNIAANVQPTSIRVSEILRTDSHQSSQLLDNISKSLTLKKVTKSSVLTTNIYNDPLIDVSVSNYTAALNIRANNRRKQVNSEISEELSLSLQKTKQRAQVLQKYLPLLNEHLSSDPSQISQFINILITGNTVNAQNTDNKFIESIENETFRARSDISIELPQNKYLFMKHVTQKVITKPNPEDSSKSSFNSCIFTKDNITFDKHRAHCELNYKRLIQAKLVYFESMHKLNQREYISHYDARSAELWKYISVIVELYKTSEGTFDCEAFQNDMNILLFG
jgi:hypothetical protein